MVAPTRRPVRTELRCGPLGHSLAVRAGDRCRSLFLLDTARLSSCAKCVCGNNLEWLRLWFCVKRNHVIGTLS